MKTFLCMYKQHMQQGKNEWWKKQNLAKTSNLLSKGSFHFWVTWTAIHNNSSLCLDWQSKLIRQKRLEMPNIQTRPGGLSCFFQKGHQSAPLQQKNWKHVKPWYVQCFKRPLDRPSARRYVVRQPGPQLGIVEQRFSMLL